MINSRALSSLVRLLVFLEHHGWCKHLVAVGLAYAATQAVLDEADEPDDGEWRG